MTKPSSKPTGIWWYLLLAGGVVLLALAGYTGYVLYPRFGLPAVEGASLLLLAVAAGIGSFFSPCSFPLLVALLGRASEIQAVNSRSFRKAFTFALALALGATTFLLISGAVLALGGEALFAGVTFASTQGRIIRAIVGTGLIILGLIQLGRIPLSLEVVGRLATPLMKTQARERRRRPFLAFAILGFAYPLAGFG
jgi:cytochrome c-type biogenesis protein